ncbi:MAG: penicillin-binding protein 2 [Pseudomonadota bacterium]
MTPRGTRPMMRPFGASRISMTIMGHRGGALEMARARVVLISAVFALVYLIMAVRLFDLTVMQGELAHVMQTETEIAAPPTPLKKPERRADIIDRNGVLLATSVKSVALFVDPHIVVDAPHVVTELVKIFPTLNRAKLEKQLAGKGRYVSLAKELTPQQQAAVTRIGDPGLAFENTYRRIYPQGNLTAHIVGYGSNDDNGLAGIERSMNAGLMKSDQPVQLAMDVRVQHILRREVERSMAHFRGIGGAGIVMDTRNGEILAATSLPDFDPHHPRNPNDNAMFNRVSLGIYEMGSTFKIFSTAAHLEVKQPSMSETFDASQPLRRGRFVINDYKGEDRVMTIPEIFMVSSNIGTALMANATGSQNLQRIYRDLGLLDAPQTELAEMGKPMVPHPWTEISNLTASFGHGIAVSPLQVASAVASVVNGGLKVQPTLLRKNEADASATAVRVLSARTSAHMRQLMRLVVEKGTGKNANVVGYRVGGKTGTAEKSGIGGYDRKRLISSFVGAFPIDDPRYVVFVMVDEPKPAADSYGYATAGWVAAPAVGRVISNMGAVLGLMPDAAAPEIAAPLHQYVNLKKAH